MPAANKPAGNESAEPPAGSVCGVSGVTTVTMGIAVPVQGVGVGSMNVGAGVGVSFSSFGEPRGVLVGSVWRAGLCPGAAHTKVVEANPIRMAPIAKTGMIRRNVISFSNVKLLNLAGVNRFARFPCLHCEQCSQHDPGQTLPPASTAGGHTNAKDGYCP